ncbi:MAG TPA: hypothetical protein VGX92_07255 [Pyrinomonadaceae bacterium]|jgi:hypothetical protein|nr:hypothetical protein [Pyrinomonadaceae bacterium]
MRVKLKALLFVALIFLMGVTDYRVVAQYTGASVSNTSIYTDIAGNKCRTIKVIRETGEAVQRCPGVAGYKLEVEDGDARMSISVVAPNGKKSELSYWHVITQSFSSLGDKAEWRVRRVRGKVVPVALIVRVHANEDSSNPEKTTSYLAVAKITPRKTCVTDKIAPGAEANEEARRAADSAARKPCLEDTLPE